VSVQLVVAGGGIGGLAAALAASRAGCDVRLLERAAAFSEVGAGVQLGPNVTRVLQAWGLHDALRSVAAFPERLQVRNAEGSELLGELSLGPTMATRYGAPYATVHRADLHSLLLEALQQHADIKMHAGRALQSFSQSAEAVRLHTATGPDVECDALIGADGLWSTVRQQMLGDGMPLRTGHLAYRALVKQSTLPSPLRTQDVTVWLGRQMHVVQYPVRSGEQLNVVAFVHGEVPDDAGALIDWDHNANRPDLLATLGGTCAGLRSLIEAIPAWRLWVMYDRPPMQGAHQHALGRVALLGDAAHPMRPYLAQGAGMAIEDAAELGNALSQAKAVAFDVPALLQRYALNRWQRNARVQARALRNGQIFHAEGVMRWGRDASMKLLGAKVLDMPWLYGAVTKVL
jgi:salicylate hydroxylase